MIRGGREGFERLKVLGRAAWPHTLDLLHLVGLPPGIRALDLGCGGGDVTLELADLIGPNGHVTGIDMDDVKLDLARETATERGLAHIEFRAKNVKDWNEPEAYDLVYSRFLLEHLSHPIELLRRMWAAVRPGGALVVEDTDFGGLFCTRRTTGSPSGLGPIRACSSVMAETLRSDGSCTSTSSKRRSRAPALR